MNTISVLEQTKDYIVVKIPRRILDRPRDAKRALTEAEAQRILSAGMKEYRQGKTKPLISLRGLRGSR